MKPCPFCAEEIQDAAIKCRFCGSMLTDAPTARPDAPAARLEAPAARPELPASRPVASAGPAEEILHARPSWKAQLGAHGGAALLVAGGLALGIALPKVWMQTTQTGVAVGGIVALLGLVWLAALWVARAVQFRITSRTIDIESGVLGRRIETVQLWKVRDLQFQQSLLDRMLGLMRIRVFTQDVTSPEVRLWGLPASRPVFERLKNATEIARQGRNVVGVME